MTVFAHNVDSTQLGAHLKWIDCGDADTFVTIVGLGPENIALPAQRKHDPLQRNAHEQCHINKYYL